MDLNYFQHLKRLKKYIDVKSKTRVAVDKSRNMEHSGTFRRLCLKVGRGLGDRDAGTQGRRDASSGTWDAGTRDVGRGEVTSGT